MSEAIQCSRVKAPHAAHAGQPRAAAQLLHTLQPAFKEWLLSSALGCLECSSRDRASESSGAGNKSTRNGTAAATVCTAQQCIRTGAGGLQHSTLSCVACVASWGSAGLSKVPGNSSQSGRRGQQRARAPAAAQPHTLLPCRPQADALLEHVRGRACRCAQIHTAFQQPGQASRRHVLGGSAHRAWYRRR